MRHRRQHGELGLLLCVGRVDDLGAATAASFFTDFSFLGLTPAEDRIHASPVATEREIGVKVEGLW
ncbi:hypothetical protein WMF18_36285 [Sorangium sp. So ce315]|uniref:hypothetical protein n=1 Tax=Sorangium sp. So ce315 TaxID=3133299 RepID=UPI003F6479CC